MADDPQAAVITTVAMYYNISTSGRGAVGRHRE